MGAYYVTALGGLERIVRWEVSTHLPGATLASDAEGGNRGRICFRYDGSPGDVLQLRSIENVFGAVEEFGGLPTDERALDVIQGKLAALDLGAALKLHERLHGPRPDPCFRCTSKRIGEHRYTSHDITAAAGAGVQERYGWRVDLENHDYDIHVDVTDDRCSIGLRLTTESLHQRTRVAHVPASLNPTLGYALCVLSDPQEGEVFLDPTCGAGTLPIERAAIGPARMLAGDIWPQPVEMAHRNFEAHDLRVGLCRWDARRLPLAPDSVDKVCANLPWGRRAGSHTVNKHLYPGLTREMARVLKVGGLAVMLSLEKRMMQRVVGRHGWLRVERTLPVSVGGLKPTIYLVRKWRGQEPPESEPAWPLPVMVQ
jgi:tRNA (guanine6-N2)-methyltransferase